MSSLIEDTGSILCRSGVITMDPGIPITKANAIPKRLAVGLVDNQAGHQRTAQGRDTRCGEESA
jgi:hypothetical protein